MAAEAISLHRDIVERSKKGDRLAQYQLYQLYSKAMFNTCYRMMNSREEAEDMLQEAFAQGFTRLHTFRFDSTFGAWLKRIVVNQCINALKKKRLELEYREDVSDWELKEDEPSQDYDQIKLDVDRIRKAVEKLPDGYRVIFSLYMFEGYDHKEIAEVLGVSESTSKSQFLRSKKRIKELIYQA